MGSKSLSAKSLRAAALALGLWAVLSSFSRPALADSTASSTKPTASHSSSKKRKGKRKTAANWRKHGQQKIDPQRAHDIQEALIRNHYMSGEPSGKWDDASQKAMEKFQADNGWQSKMIPDSRALIKLGLGPDHQHLLNPESAMTTPPQRQPASSSAPPHSNPPASTESSSQN